MGNLLLNLTLGEPLFLVKNLPSFDDPIEMYVLLLGAFPMCIHDLVNCSLLKDFGFEF